MMIKISTVQYNMNDCSWQMLANQCAMPESPDEYKGWPHPQVLFRFVAQSMEGRFPVSFSSRWHSNMTIRTTAMLPKGIESSCGSRLVQLRIATMLFWWWITPQSFPERKTACNNRWGLGTSVNLSHCAIVISTWQVLPRYGCPTVPRSILLRKTLPSSGNYSIYMRLPYHSPITMTHNDTMSFGIFVFSWLPPNEPHFQVRDLLAHKWSIYHWS